MSSKQEAAMTATDLRIGYASKRGEIVVAGRLSLNLRRGEMVCLLGPNGAGKSTLIRSLAGLEPPLSGRIELTGVNVDALSARQRARMLSVVLTDGTPTGLLSSYGLVALGRHPHTRWTGSLSSKDHQRIEWSLRAVGAESLASRRVAELSDGERQKVLIARALAQEASILLLDEPTAFVDLPRRVELMTILRDLAHQEGLAVLLSSHDLEMSLRCADRLWLMGAGGVIQQGSPESLALGGAIAATFANEVIDWDATQGGFRMHREPTRFARLEGEGEAALWTRRALARLGFGISEEREVALTVIVGGLEGESTWRVRKERNSEMLFDSLEALVEWIGSSF